MYISCLLNLTTDSYKFISMCFITNKRNVLLLLLITKLNMDRKKFEFVNTLKES